MRDGKRQDRVRVAGVEGQIGLDPETGRIVRERARRKRRPIGLQLVHLIEIGVDHDPEFPANGNRPHELHMAAHESTSPETLHAAAPRGTSLHTAAREKAAS